VNEEFKKVVYYFRAHKLALHPKKTKFVIFSHASFKNNPIVINIDFNNFSGVADHDLITPIEFVNNSQNPDVKFLGVIFDSTPNFKAHISSISSKISKSLFIIRRAKNFLTPPGLKALYYSLVQSHLIYCTHICSSAASSLLNELSKKQKVVIRLIKGAPYNAHTEKLFKSSAILPLQLLIEFFKLQFVYQFLNNHLPVSFVGTWITNAARRDDQDGPALRNALDLFVPFSRLTSTSKHPLIAFPKTWNEFNAIEIKLASSKQIFNKALKTHLLGSLTDNPLCNRLLCPHCHL
jgi:hypothetical protein